MYQNYIKLCGNTFIIIVVVVKTIENTTILGMTSSFLDICSQFLLFHLRSIPAHSREGKKFKKKLTFL